MSHFYEDWLPQVKRLIGNTEYRPDELLKNTVRIGECFVELYTELFAPLRKRMQR